MPSNVMGKSTSERCSNKVNLGYAQRKYALKRMGKKHLGEVFHKIAPGYRSEA